MAKKPIELAEVKSTRGDLDAVALLKALIEDIEASGVRPKVMLVVCGKDEGPDAYRVDVRMAGGAPMLALGLLEAAKASILQSAEPIEDPGAAS